MNEITTVDDRFLLPAVGSDMQALWQETQQSLAVIGPLHSVWDRSNSNWALKNLTLSMGGHTVIRQLRQISAEVEHRSMAMSEAKFGLLRKQAEVEEGRRRLAEDTLTTFERTMIELDIAQKEEQAELTLRKFSGAMKDVAALKRCYDELVAQNGGVPSAEEAESEAHFSSLVRALLQSLRDMRQGGVILWGNQEFLEQCGVNPTTAFNELKPFIEAEQKHRFGGTKELMEFVYALAEALIQRGDAPSIKVVAPPAAAQ